MSDQIILVSFHHFLKFNKINFILGNQQLPVLHSYNRELLTKVNDPVYMTQQTFFQMLYTPDGHQWSRFESFLASSILVRQFAKGVTEPFDATNPTVRKKSNLFSSFKLNFRFVQYQMNKIPIE